MEFICGKIKWLKDLFRDHSEELTCFRFLTVEAVHFSKTYKIIVFGNLVVYQGVQVTRKCVLNNLVRFFLRYIP